MKNLLKTEELERRKKDREEDIRGCYYRDETAIIHSRPFRRLKHKTQVFFSPDDDHVCTRVEHVLHVASIAKTICKGLKNKLGEGCELDEDLAYSIGLGHDLGHAPFGHAGEDALSQKLGRKFIHEVNSYRVIEKLSNAGAGLNLTYAVKDGIICHNGEEFLQKILPEHKIKDLDKVKDRNNLPSTWEGCIVRMSDSIAYLGRDIEDAIVAKFIDGKDIPPQISEIIGSSNGEIINYLICDIVENSTKDELSFSDNCFSLLKLLKKFNYDKIYNHERIKEYKKYCGRIICTLYDHLLTLLSDYNFEFERYSKSNYDLDRFFGGYLKGMKEFYLEEKSFNNWCDGEMRKQIIADYISGMTDKFAIDSMRELCIPKPIEFKPNIN